MEVEHLEPAESPGRETPLQLFGIEAGNSRPAPYQTAETAVVPASAMKDGGREAATGREHSRDLAQGFVHVRKEVERPAAVHDLEARGAKGKRQSRSSHQIDVRQSLGAKLSA